MAQRPVRRFALAWRQFAGHLAGQLRDLLGLGFTGFNFILGDPDPIASMQQIAHDVLPTLRAAG